MPMIVSPRSRYWRSYSTSDGTVRVQLPHVNTQKLSSTTRPRSSESRSGRSALSQLALVSSGAGVPPALDGGAGRRIAAALTATSPATTRTALDAVSTTPSRRVVILILLAVVNGRLPLSASRRGGQGVILESRESPRAGGQAPDRPQRGEVAVPLDAERVDYRGGVRPQHVQKVAVSTQRDIVHPTTDHGAGPVRVDEADRPVGRDGEVRNRAAPVGGEAEAPVVGHYGPARRALVGEHGATHDLEIAAPSQDVRRCRARGRGFRHEQQVTRAEREPERRPAGGRERRASAGRAVRVHGVHVEQIGVLLGDDQAAAIGAERHLRRPDVGAGEWLGGARDRSEPAGRADCEPADVAGAARVQHVECVTVHGEADRQRAAGRRAARERQARRAHAEDGDRIAGRLVGERVDGALTVHGAVGALRLERRLERRGRVGDGAVLLARRESRGGEREESEVLRHGAIPPENCGLTLSASREVTLTCGTADLARARYERVLILLSGRH